MIAMITAKEWTLRQRRRAYERFRPFVVVSGEMYLRILRYVKDQSDILGLDTWDNGSELMFMRVPIIKESEYLFTHGPTCSQGVSFMRAVFDSQYDALPRLVFADWLEENGDDEMARIMRDIASDVSGESCDSPGVG